MTKDIIKVLIADELSDLAVNVFEENGIQVDFNPEIGKVTTELDRLVGDYDGLAIRSNTKVTSDLIKKAKKLKVIGRAGIGVDNIDVNAASANGVVVMNTPFGNSITTAEHTIAMILSVARKIPDANVSTHAGKWEKSKYIGVEVTGKILGIIGVGNVGSVVASRALGLKMRVVAFDPFLSIDKAIALGVEKVETLKEVLACSDFLSLHVPKTKATKNLISKSEIISNFLLINLGAIKVFSTSLESQL